MAAADAQRWQLGGRHSPGQRQLAAVPFGIDAVNRLVQVPAVERGLDVAAPGENQAVDQVEEFLPRIVAGRNHHGDAAGSTDRVDVNVRQPKAAVFVATVSGNADDGTPHDLRFPRSNFSE